uniref:Uncharacterized protein n=1 Tax=Arundo donax TaxID=35708 RepID=A0A0A9CJY3_ARUDO
MKNVYPMNHARDARLHTRSGAAFVLDPNTLYALNSTKLST